MYKMVSTRITVICAVNLSIESAVVYGISAYFVDRAQNAVVCEIYSI